MDDSAYNWGFKGKVLTLYPLEVLTGVTVARFRLVKPRGEPFGDLRNRIVWPLAFRRTVFLPWSLGSRPSDLGSGVPRGPGRSK